MSRRRQLIAAAQNSVPTNKMIFADAEVERVLLANMQGLSHTDYITKDEFAALTDVNSWFKNTDISEFMELKDSGIINLSVKTAFDKCTKLVKIDLSNIQKLYYYPFRNCTSLKALMLPKVYSIGNDTLSTHFLCGTPNMKVCDLGYKQTQIGYFMSGVYTTKLILRCPNVVTWNYGLAYGSLDASFAVFVPESVVESYKDANRWSTYATQIFAISGDKWQSVMQTLAVEEGYTLKEGESWADEYIDYKIYGYEPPTT